MKRHLSKLFFLILLVLWQLTSVAQPFLTGVNGNAEIKEYLRNCPVPVKALYDTVALPFFDDFVYRGPYPSNKYWSDNYAFINRSFSVNPPSAGVATFDALNQSGELYATLSSNQSVGDYLTSKFINLQYYTVKNPLQIPTYELLYYDNISGLYLPADSLWYIQGGTIYNCLNDTNTFNVDMYIAYIQHIPPDSVIHNANASLYYYNGTDTVPIPYSTSPNYTLADSLYFSFYYQPQGYSANAPENNDSLVLQFYYNDFWHTVWRAGGTSVHPFRQVMIPLNDTAYLIRDFRFRFYNYVSTGGSANPSWNNNCDYWHIDYVYINKNRSQGDTIPDDMCFTDQWVSFIKNYRAVPFEHFKASPSIRNDTIRFTIRNLSSSPKNANRNVNVFHYPSSLVYNPSPSNENINATSDSLVKFPAPVNFFNVSQTDSAYFYARFTVSGGLSEEERFYGRNDTMFQDIRFKQYYAYDDGVAENGFGLGGIGTQNARLAYRFNTLIPDTLRGVYIYFNPTLNNFTGSKYFYLMVWSNSNSRPSEVLCEQIGEKPEFGEGMYKFMYYPLDTPQLITDTFYVGWKQTTTDLLNVGFDANNNSRFQTLYNISGVWEYSPYEGSLMMRPVFSTGPFLKVPETLPEAEMHVYPSPAQSRIYIRVPGNDELRTELYDLQGRCVYSGLYYEEGIDISSFENGIYILAVTGNQRTLTRKIIIYR
jgi:hypothetical protein